MALQFSVKGLAYLNIGNSLLQRNCQRLMTRASQRFYAADKDLTPVTPAEGNVPPAEGNVSPASPNKGATGPQTIGPLTAHRVNQLEKYLLVWGGKYEKVADVPNLVSQDTMERARNKARIKISIMMMIATLLACIVMVISGKKAQREGQSLVKINQDWHRKISEESKGTS